MTTGVLFDLDETLIDRTASISAYAGRFYEEFESSIGDPADAFLDRFLELDGNGYVDRETFFALLEGYLATPKLNRHTISAHFAENAWTSPVTMQGAESGLRALRNSGLPIAIVTNGGSRNQRKKLENTGLAHLVDAIVISEEFGAKKPDPSIFLAACRQLQIDPDGSWFVGDNPALDIVGADTIGLQTVWLQRTITWPREHAVCYTKAVSSLEEAFNTLLFEPER